MPQHTIPPLAISMGEPAGVGPDLILQLFADRQALDLPPFIVFGQAELLRSRASRIGLSSLNIVECAPEDATSSFAEALPVVSLEGLVSDHPGQPSSLAGKLVIGSIAEAVRAVRHGDCRGLVTAPIHKASLYAAGFEHPGHTEYLAALCASGREPLLPVMMLAHEDLRVVPATIHIPLREVPQRLSSELLLRTGRIVAHDLRTRFHVAAPKLAFAGLNPHAGEGGAIGTEDLDLIVPVVRQLQDEDVSVVGPLPADTLFHLPHWRQFDAVIAMYHDQALIPIKTVAFDQAVNVTLGLPIVRTSPDHGTAFDLAGTGSASPSSMLAAIRMADQQTRAAGGWRDPAAPTLDTN